MTQQQNSSSLIRLLIAVALGLVGLVAACSVVGYDVIEPGHVGIQVELSGSGKGVKDLPLKTGRIFYNKYTSYVFNYPTFVQTAVWTQSKNEGHAIDESITFTNKDQLSINGDISLSYSLQDVKTKLSDCVPAFYQKFRSDDLEKFTHGFLRNIARDKFNEIGGTRSIEQIMGDNGAFLAEVRSAVQAEVAGYCVSLDQFGVIGAFRPPDAVTQSINAKIKATQDAIRVQNEVQQTQAEAAKNVAQAEGNAKAQVAQAKGQAEAAIAAAEGLAKANQIKANSLTPTILEWERLMVQTESVRKWNGALPQTVFGGNTPTILSIPAPGK